MAFFYPKLRTLLYTIVESEESGQLDVTGWIKVQYVDKSGKPLANKKYYIYLLEEKCISGTTDENGLVLSLLHVTITAKSSILTSLIENI